MLKGDYLLLRRIFLGLKLLSFVVAPLFFIPSPLPPCPWVVAGSQEVEFDLLSSLPLPIFGVGWVGGEGNSERVNIFWGAIMKHVYECWYS